MKNKQKQWRSDAARARREFIALGKHAVGQLYGRHVKAAWGAVKFKAIPSTLFQVIGINAGILKAS